MKIVIRGREFYMDWTYETVKKTLHQKNKETKKEEEVEVERRGTTCNIKGLVTGVSYSATTVFNPRDGVWSKEEGRKYSIEKLMKELALTRPERTDLWDQYFSRERNFDLASRLTSILGKNGIDITIVSSEDVKNA